MKEKQENRRVRMTKQLMKDALLELLEKQDLVSISVTAICETADVHRSTFYKYYRDPADLLREIENDCLNFIPVPPRNLEELDEKALLKTTTDFFNTVKENRKAFRILFGGAAGTGFMSRMVEYLCEGYLLVDTDTDETTRRYINLYIANGTVGMLREWISTDFSVSSRKIAEMMYYYSRKVFP